MKLPPQTKADRLALAQFGAADIAEVAAFADGLAQPGAALKGSRVVRISADVARQFWTAGTADSRFTFNRATLQFFGKGGAVDPAVVKAAADAASKEARARIYDAASRLQQGAIDAPQWAQEHNAAVKLLTGAESALGRGGLAEMTMADWQRAGDKTFEQFGYSRAFAEDIARGRYGTPGVSMADAPLQRAVMYADYGRAVYENTRVENAKDRLGHDKARRLLGASDHCPGCVDAAADGWVDIADVLPIGEADCLTRCNCVIITGNEGNLID